MIWGWIFSTLLGATAVIVLITRYSPQEGKIWVMPAVYAGIFLTAFGLVAIIGFVLRLRFLDKAGRNMMVRTASRQGVFLGLMSVAILMLSAQNFFNWWTAGLIFAMFVLLELYAR